MGCNLNEISQCTNKCDCGDLNTLMFKGTGKTEIESEKQKKLNIMRKYNENKNIFQITRENDISKNVFSVNITDNNDTNKQENQNKEQKNVKICFHNKKANNLNQEKPKEEEIDTMLKENKMNYINNCMNNVTIEDKEKNEENNSIYEDNKDSFLNMENNKNDENEKIFDKEECSNIEEKIDKSSEDIQDININKNNVDEDLFNMMNSKDKENGGENEIEFEGEKCIFNGVLDDKINICGKGKINLKDGRTYEGTFVDGKLEGEGTYINNKGDIYIGGFIGGKLNGKGKIIQKRENINKSNGGNEQENINNKDNNDDNNLVYEGEIKDFKREGHGVEKCPEYVYDGNFHDDMKNGQGSIKYLKLGRKYKGEFKNNEITGYGYLIYENKQTYKGDLVDGKKEGKGKYIWPDGSEYEGEYKNDIREGEGSLKWANGLIFKGKFHNGRPEGKGKLYSKNSIKDVEYRKGKFFGNLNETIKNLKINLTQVND